MKNYLTNKSVLLNSTLVLILSAGCAIGNMPDFPSTIVHHYVTEVRDEPIPASLYEVIVNLNEISDMDDTQVVRCLKFDIISKIPYKIKFVSVVPTAECNGVGGYKVEDSLSLYNWIEDVAAWAEGRKKCFK